MLYISKINLRPKSGSSSKQNAADAYHKARIYVWVEGENVMQNLEARHNRPYKTYKEEVLPTLFRLLGLEGINVGWSKSAGCSMCPCSPGFVVKRETPIPYDIHVTVTEKYTKNIEIGGSLQR